MRAIRTVFWGIILTCLYFAIFVVGLARGRSRAELRSVVNGWSSALLRAFHVKLDVVGLEKILPDTPYVVVANHTTQLDIPFLFSGLPIDFRFFAKIEVRKIPIIGYSAARIGTVFVNRKAKETHAESLAAVKAVIQERGSVLFFPEGTRSRTGRLQEFKKGAFVVAIEHGLPILPVIIENGFVTLPKGSVSVRPGKVIMRIMDPIPTKGLSYEDREVLRDRVFDLYRKHFDRSGSP